MADMRPHRKLLVWKRSIELVTLIYRITSSFPKSEQFGLTSQMRRAAVSVPSNLAEGAARKGKKEFKQFLNIAQGSISELDTQTEVAHRLNYITDEDYTNVIQELTEISKMLYGLAKTLE